MGLHDGRVAVITGAAGGIGREHALEFARQGAKVVVNDVGPAQDVVDEIVAAGGEAVANSDDISDWDGAGRLMPPRWTLSATFTCSSTTRASCATRCSSTWTSTCGMR